MEGTGCHIAGTARIVILCQWGAHQEFNWLRRSSLLALDLQGQVPTLHAGSYEPLRQVSCNLTRLQSLPWGTCSMCCRGSTTSFSTVQAKPLHMRLTVCLSQLTPQGPTALSDMFAR